MEREREARELLRVGKIKPSSSWAEICVCVCAGVPVESHTFIAIQGCASVTTVRSSASSRKRHGSWTGCGTGAASLAPPPLPPQTHPSV